MQGSHHENEAHVSRLEHTRAIGDKRHCEEVLRPMPVGARRAEIERLMLPPLDRTDVVPCHEGARADQADPASATGTDLAEGAAVM